MEIRDLIIEIGDETDYSKLTECGNIMVDAGAKFEAPLLEK